MVYTPPLLHAYREVLAAHASRCKSASNALEAKNCVPEQSQSLTRKTIDTDQRARALLRKLYPRSHGAPKELSAPVQCIDGTHPLRQKRRHAHYNLRLRKQGKTGPRLSRHASQGLAAWILTEKGRRERMTCAHSSPYNREALPALCCCFRGTAEFSISVSSRSFFSSTVFGADSEPASTRKQRERKACVHDGFGRRQKGPASTYTSARALRGLRRQQKNEPHTPRTPPNAER